MFCQRKRVEYLLDDPMYDDGVRENVVAYDEEGAGQYIELITIFFLKGAQ